MADFPDFAAVDREYSCNDELGAVYSREQTVFRVWSPMAEQVRLRLYKSAQAAEPFQVSSMEKRGGVWELRVPGDLHGIFYTYCVTINGAERETIDIYARSAGANGVRGMIADLSRTDPEGWEHDRPVRLSSPVDAVIYELHVRDFSSDRRAGFRLRGKFEAFCEDNVRNSFGDRAGLDYIASLGVTHIHLLPVFDFQTVDENDPTPGYNWGYDPLNYNIPEGSYTTDPNNGVKRIREFKELVQAVHSRGMGVIMDVVYNHTYSTEDSPFSKTFPDYYYRHRPDGSLSNGSGCGNEFASERTMASRFIIDSLCYLAQEYHLDGFRFDLMGLLDISTLNRSAERLREINPSVILYGEGWTGGETPLDESLRAVKGNAVKLPHFAVFSDDLRDCVKGSVFSDTECGYVSGNAENQTELLKSVMSAGVFRPDVERPQTHCWTDDPQQVVNYVEAHDNLTLYDKLRLSMSGSAMEEIIAADKLAAALVMFSQGIPFMQAGQEILRSKPAPGGGYVHDSYNSPDSVNSIKWDDVTRNYRIKEYYRGLIAVRKRFPQFRMRSAEDIRTKITYEELGGGALAVYLPELLLLVNPSDRPLEFDPGSPANIYANGERASAEPLYQTTGAVSVAPRSVLLLSAIGPHE